jgi:hypothetical protein
MLTNPQKSLLKRAQREAGLSDDDYRDALEMITGCRSSTSPTLTDQHLDKLLCYFEAIHWRGVDVGTLQTSCSANAVFRQRGFWVARNNSQETSRDRFNDENLGSETADLESQLAALGCGPGYCAAIRKNVCKGRSDARALHLYQAALKRTLKSKAAQRESAENPY